MRCADGRHGAAHRRLGKTIMGYGELICPAAGASASAAGRWRSHDAAPSPTRAGRARLALHRRNRKIVTNSGDWSDNDPNGMTCSCTWDPPSRLPLRRPGPTDANPDASGLVERSEYTRGVCPRDLRVMRRTEGDPGNPDQQANYRCGKVLGALSVVAMMHMTSSLSTHDPCHPICGYACALCIAVGLRRRRHRG